MTAILLNHLWQSTWFALVAAGVALCLRRYRARVRFWCYAAGAFKFLVPFALLTVLAGWMAPRNIPAASAPQPAAAAVVAPVATSPADNFSPLGVPAVPAHGSALWWFALWLAGALAVGGLWLRRWVRMRRMVRGGAATIAPGVYGVFRQTVILPEELDPATRAAVLAHEMCHVRSRDNLWMALQTLTQTLFWFHPLVWWLGGRMLAEREQACDEAALAAGFDPTEYARALLGLCRHFTAAPGTCAAAMTGRDLQHRIRQIMRPMAARALPRAMVGALGAGLLTATALGVVYGQAANGPAPHFDAASIRLWAPGEGPKHLGTVGLVPTPGRLRAQCVSLRSLLFFAFDLTGSEPIRGLPEWGRAPCSEGDSPNAFAMDIAFPSATPVADQRLMMQTLLRERFHMQAHWEKQRMKILALEVAPGGLKLKPSDPDKDPPIKPHSIGCPADSPGCHHICCGSMTMTVIADLLTDNESRPVIDETGVKGNYYFGVFTWSGPEGTSLPSLPTALKQVGLELKATTAQVPILVITHVEKPTPN